MGGERKVDEPSPSKEVPLDAPPKPIEPHALGLGPLDVLPESTEQSPRKQMFLDESRGQTWSEKEALNVLSEPPMHAERSSAFLQKAAEQTLPTDQLLNFAKLPKEIQGMIWEYALEGMTPLVEVAFDPKKQHFKVSGPASAILALCGPSKIVKGVEAIQFDSIKPGIGPSIHYMCPVKDVLYIPTLDDLDIEAFLARPENQGIQKLGIQADCADEQFHFYNYPEEITREVRLMMGLKNLKTIFLLDGENQGDERRIDHSLNYDLELEDLPKRSHELSMEISRA